MLNTRSMAAMAVAIAAAMSVSTVVHAQTAPIQAWEPPKELDPAKRVSPATGTAPEQAQPAYSRPYGAQQASGFDESSRGGFFVGLKGGKGWVYDDVDQPAQEIHGGYRWQAGSVALVGIELAGGMLKETVDDGWSFEQVDYGSIGVNARFNFGSSSPVFALVRAGYMSADYDRGNVDGGYFGVGLGVDIDRHFNLSLVYSNYVYFNELYWEGGTLYYDADRADTLMLGAEARF